MLSGIDGCTPVDVADFVIGRDSPATHGCSAMVFTRRMQTRGALINRKSIMLRRRPIVKEMYKFRIALNSLSCLSPGGLFNYMKYKLHPPKEIMHLSRFAPVLGAILVTRRCNLKCSFCILPNLESELNIQEYEADVPGIERIIEHPAFRRVLIIGLSGGEPLLNDHLIDIVRLIRKKRHVVSLTTNALLLKQQLRDLITSKITLINVSLYDTNQDIVANVLPEVNLKMLSRLSKVLLRSEVEHHPGRIEDAVRLATESGLNSIYFMPYLPGNRSVDEVIFADNMHYSELKRRLNEKYSKCLIYWPTPLKRTLDIPDKRCRMLWFYIQSDALGNIGLCCNRATNGSGGHGNLFRGNSNDILNSEEMVRMRKMLISNTAGIPDACQNCPIMMDEWMSDY